MAAFLQDEAELEALVLCQGQVVAMLLTGTVDWFRGGSMEHSLCTRQAGYGRIVEAPVKDVGDSLETASVDKVQALDVVESLFG